MSEQINEIQIVVDACADIPDAIRKEKLIAVIPLGLYYKDSEYNIGVDWGFSSPKDFYKSLREGDGAYTLSASEYNITKCFKEYLKQGKDIIYISECNIHSKTFEKANRIREILKEKYPEQRICIIDSLNVSVGIGILAIKALEMAKEGKSIDEIEQTILNLREHVVEIGIPQEMKYLSDTNKVVHSLSLFGNFMRKTSILTSDRLGKQYAITHTRGREQSLRVGVKLFLERLSDVENQTIYVVHSDDDYAAEFCIRLIKQSNPSIKAIEKMYFCPAVGSATGPGTIGLFGTGIERETID